MSNPSQQSTPQDAAAGFRQAVIAGRWSAAFKYMVPEVRKSLVGGLCMEAAYAADGEGGDARERLGHIMQKHGLRGQGTREWTDSELLAALRDLLAWFENSVPEEKRVNLAQSMADIEYTNYRVSGDFAYAKYELKGKVREQRFKCLDGKWYLA
ncbi:MAG: hypothetical protein AAFN78_18360 [Pseudomonadota bacterium]